MPREPRIYFPGFPLHITQRGVNRCAIFVDDVDRQHYYDLLHEVMGDHGIAIHAYVFMGNHVHLLLTPTEAGALSRAMRNVGQCYVQAFNRRHRRCGTLWQGRFKSCLVDSEHYLMSVYRYIELNPVRAAMVVQPEEFHWSSVHANLYLRTDPLVVPHKLFLGLGKNPRIRAEVYREWLQDGTSQSDLERIRVYIQQERALGDVKFQAMVEKALGRPVQSRPRGQPRRVDCGLDDN